jgi:hypothetical protein
MLNVVTSRNKWQLKETIRKGEKIFKWRLFYKTNKITDKLAY